ncbi:MAG TPA: CehA/McbA family metallohydrolase [Candidatus Dormibacteraeota bacterium]|jgi:hypothetical protein|nr:CehA/McbA family metallohydrolase [Candidatus Dormibacteraeota bacterium]
MPSNPPVAGAGPNRREFLKLAGAAGVGSALAPAVVVRALASSPPSQTITMSGVAVGYGQYLYFPFTVPVAPEVNRIDVSVAHDVNNSSVVKLGAGLFDQRGAQYQSPGFRGIYGEERSQFFVSAGAASQSFIPGTILPGTWTVVVPVFLATVPTNVTVTVTLSFGPQGLAFVPGAAQLGVVRPGAAWYRGDLHAHTPESSDAWGSRTAQDPATWARHARTVGLDFVAMTDHNVVSQNFNLARDAGSTGTLLIAGEEMTNWAHGHATVTGIDVGQWLDWRQRPLSVPLGPNEARINDFIKLTRAMGAYVAAAHPYGANLLWQFFADSDADPSGAADPTGLEVWTGLYQPDDDASVRQWDAYLRQGRRIYANGGSDIHGLGSAGIALLGTPTNHVWAANLAKADIVDALRHGRNVITRTIDGAAIYLSAAGPAGQHQVVGGSMYGDAADLVHVEVVVRKGAGMTLHVLHSNIGDAAPAVPQTFAITSDDQAVRLDVPIGSAGGFVRAELHGQMSVPPGNPTSGYLDMEALSNPLFLVHGPIPAGTVPTFAPPPAISPAASAPPGSTAVTVPSASGGLPNSGPAAPAAGAATAVAGATAAAAALAARARRHRQAAEDMTLFEVTLRAHAGGSLDGRLLRLTGQITARSDNGDAVLTRWVHSCGPAPDTPVTVHLATPEALGIGSWIETEATWLPGTGVAGESPPRLQVRRWRPLVTPPPRLEAGAGH